MGKNKQGVRKEERWADRWKFHYRGPRGVADGVAAGKGGAKCEEPAVLSCSVQTHSLPASHGAAQKPQFDWSQMMSSSQSLSFDQVPPQHELWHSPLFENLRGQPPQRDPVVNCQRSYCRQLPRSLQHPVSTCRHRLRDLHTALWG